jgi:hypothetical protein
LTVRILQPPARVHAQPGRRAVSYLGDGRQVVWEPERPGRIAVDAEVFSRPVPAALAARFGPSSARAFFAAWTQAECAAKLNAIPIVVWLRERGLQGDPRLETATHVIGDVVVTTARVRTRHGRTG